MELFKSLKEKLNYLSKEQISDIVDCYHFAKEAHDGQFRSSGEPYITHPIAVAEILTEIKIDKLSIMAALLHDVIEDTKYNKECIEERFGTDVAELVDGVSKIDKIKFSSKVELQAENVRKMILAMSQDLRVILIKLADRLHNLRTLSYVSKERQKKISKETSEIYAPIAYRLGMNRLYAEMQNHCFKYLNPYRFKVIEKSVKKISGDRKDTIEKIKEDIIKSLAEENINYVKIVSREKDPFSIYKKMQKKGLSLNEVLDIFAIRVIVDSLSDSYIMLGILHSCFRPIHNKFKDYIAVPKSNGYKSLHTTLIGPYGIPIEIQIRTVEMDRLAESGLAAHWLYKLDNYEKETTLRARDWIKDVLEHSDDNNYNSAEFLEHIKLDLYPHAIYVFGPEGDVISLPKGSTAIDFAYSVGFETGNSCVATKINNRIVPLNTILESGQIVDIITTSTGNPNPSWLNFAVTAKARLSIKRFLSNQKDKEARELGLRLFNKSLMPHYDTYETIPKEKIDKLLEDLKAETIDEIFYNIGIGEYIAPVVSARLFTDQSELTDKYSFTIKGLEGVVVNYCNVCYPIPGDSISGLLSPGSGISVHRSDCSLLTDLNKEPENFLSLEWSQDVVGTFKVSLEVLVNNEKGVLAKVSAVISKSNSNIRDVVVEDQDDHTCKLNFIILVDCHQHLEKVMTNLINLDYVSHARRS